MKTKLPTISHARGRGQVNHNNRVHVYKNVDQSRTKDNVTYVKESLDVAYEKCFGKAQRAYDEKQAREDRKINDYYTHLFGEASKHSVAESTKGQLSYYEFVAGVGCKNTCPVGSENGKFAAKILDEYMIGFQERNPSFYVFNAVLHLDEATPGLHVDYIPLATGYKRGMEVQNGHAKALEQMGFGNSKGSIDEWRKNERAILRNICKKHGLEIAEEKKGRGKTFAPDEYKHLINEVKEELRADPDLLDELKEELRYEFIDENKQALVKEAKAAAKDEIDALANEIGSKKEELAIADEELKKTYSERRRLESENNKISKMMEQRDSLAKQIKEMKPIVDKRFSKHYKDYNNIIDNEVKDSILGGSKVMSETAYNKLLEYASAGVSNTNTIDNLAFTNNFLNGQLKRAEKELDKVRPVYKKVLDIQKNSPFKQSFDELFNDKYDVWKDEQKKAHNEANKRTIEQPARPAQKAPKQVSVVQTSPSWDTEYMKTLHERKAWSELSQDEKSAVRKLLKNKSSFGNSQNYEDFKKHFKKDAERGQLGK